MDYLSELFQNNPLMVAIVSCVTLVSGGITVVSYWRPFWRDVLSRKVPVYAVLIFFSLAVMAISLWPAVGRRPKGMRTIEGETFGIQRVIVDGKRFVNCTFNKTELVFRGEVGGGFEGCKLVVPQLTFDGPAARTVRILRTLYTVPQLQPLIENTFAGIRTGNLSVAVPPSDAARD